MGEIQSPSQTIGPLYGFALMFEGSHEAVPPDSPGAVRIEGLIVDGDGVPLSWPEGFIEVWEGDQWARARTDANGRYAVAGLATMLLCWRYRFELARVTAALAVAAVVIGWAAGQAPRFLPGLTVAQAAAGRSTLVALIIAVVFGAVVLVPSLALLFTLYLRGRLDTAEHEAAPGPVAAREAGRASGGRGAGPSAIGARRDGPPERP